MQTDLPTSFLSLYIKTHSAYKNCEKEVTNNLTKSQATTTTGKKAIGFWTQWSIMKWHNAVVGVLNWRIGEESLLKQKMGINSISWCMSVLFSVPLSPPSFAFKCINNAFNPNTSYLYFPTFVRLMRTPCYLVRYLLSWFVVRSIVPHVVD